MKMNNDILTDLFLHIAFAVMWAGGFIVTAGLIRYTLKGLTELYRDRKGDRNGSS